jgi:hypothetical protein
MRRLILLASILVLSACGAVLPDTFTEADLPDPGALSQEWGCGFGFWLSNRDQSVALQLAYTGEGSPPATTDLPSPLWEARLIVGTDLYANWCDDVIETDEPTPVEHWVLPVVGGRIEVEGEAPEPFSGGELRFTAEDLVVELPDGTQVAWGDVAGRNPNWGFMAG